MTPQMKDRLFDVATDMRRRRVRQQDVAAAVGITQGDLSQMLAGKQPFRFSKFLRVLAASKTDYKVLFPDLDSQLADIRMLLRTGEQEDGLLTLANLIDCAANHDELKKAG